VHRFDEVFVLTQGLDVFILMIINRQCIKAE
jgi:hypothetical protein